MAVVVIGFLASLFGTFGIFMYLTRKWGEAKAELESLVQQQLSVQRVLEKQQQAVWKGNKDMAMY